MQSIESVIEGTPEDRQRSRSPYKNMMQDSEQLPARLRQLAGLNRTGTTKLFTPTQLYNEANEYFEKCSNNPILSEQLLTGGQRAGEVIQVRKPRMFTMQGLCLSMNINTQYIYDLGEQIKDKEDEASRQYSFVIAYIRETISQQRFENSAVREFDGAFIAKLEGLKDSIEHSGEIKQTYTSIVFQTRNVEEVAGEDVTDTAKDALSNL